jgi:hypothetical protein
MAEIVQGLFGVSPESLNAQREQALQSQALQYAQLDPNQQAQMGFYQAGSRLGTGLAGLMGAQDPEMQKASFLQGLSKQYDPTTAEGLTKAAQALAQAGYGREAMQAGQAAQAMQQQQAALSKTKAETVKALREKEGADPFQQLLRTGKFSTAGVAKYEQTGNIADLGEPIEKISKTEIEQLQAYRDTLPADSSKRAEVDAIIKATGKPKGSIGTDLALGLSPVLNALVSGQTKEAAKVGGAEAAKNIAALEGKYEAGYAVNDALDLLGKGIYSGGYAPAEEAIAKYGMGILGNKKRLVNTQEFKAQLANVVIPRLKEFGGSDTVEELKYLQAASGANTDTEPEALQRILQSLQKKMSRSVERAQRQNKELQTGQPFSAAPTGDRGGEWLTTAGGVKYRKAP